MKKLAYRGGIPCGTLLVLYGFLSIASGGLISENTALQNACFGLMAFGGLLGIYFLGRRSEIMGVPVILSGLMYGACSMLTSHDVMAAMCFSLGLVSFIGGVLMYAIAPVASVSDASSAT